MGRNGKILDAVGTADEGGRIGAASCESALRRERRKGAGEEAQKGRWGLPGERRTVQESADPCRVSAACPLLKPESKIPSRWQRVLMDEVQLVGSGKAA